MAALSPETVTLGTLRASNTLRAHASRRGRDASLWQSLGITFEGCNCSLVGAELPAQQLAHAPPDEGRGHPSGSQPEEPQSGQPCDPPLPVSSSRK
jgi:hypothetical protein